MTRPLTALALFAAVLGTSGCATQQQQLQARQEGAVQSALQRGDSISTVRPRPRPSSRATTSNRPCKDRG